MGVAKKVGITVASLLLVVGIVIGAVAIIKSNETAADPETTSAASTTSSKTVEAICEPTKHKEACVSTLNSVKPDASIKDYLEAAVKATMAEVRKAMNATSNVVIDKDDDPHNDKEGIEECKNFLTQTIEQLEASITEIVRSDIDTIQKKAEDFNAWLTGANIYMRTCVDQMEKAEYKSDVEKGMVSAIQLTENALYIFAKIKEVLGGLNISIDTLSSFIGDDTSKASRKLLSDEVVGHGDDDSSFPQWVSAAERKLLRARVPRHLTAIEVAPQPNGDAPQPIGVAPPPIEVAPQPIGVAPQPIGVAPAPQINGVTPAPQPSVVSPVPQPTGVAPAPQINGVAPTPQINGVTPAPQPSVVSPVPQPIGVAPAPQIIGVAPTPQINGVTPAPQPSVVSPVPQPIGVAPQPNVVSPVTQPIVVAPQQIDGVAQPNIVVAQDGSGQFMTITEAVNAVPLKNTQRFIIYVKAGIYSEIVQIKGKNYVYLMGDGIGKTIITGNLCFFKGVKTSATATVGVDSDFFMAKGITFENSAGPDDHQAVALRINGEKAIVYECEMRSYQDTLYYHKGIQFYKDCVISGTVDFIFGNGRAIIQDSLIVAKKPGPNQANMITADGGLNDVGIHGLMLQNCTIVAEPDLMAAKNIFKTFLGRPWKEAAVTYFLQNDIADFIAPEGYSPFTFTGPSSTNQNTAIYGEYDNRGPGAKNDARDNTTFPHFKILSAQEAEEFTVEKFIYGLTWLPESGVPFNAGLYPDL